MLYHARRSCAAKPHSLRSDGIRGRLETWQEKISIREKCCREYAVSECNSQLRNILFLPTLHNSCRTASWLEIMHQT